MEQEPAKPMLHYVWFPGISLIFSTHFSESWVLSFELKSRANNSHFYEGAAERLFNMTECKPLHMLNRTSMETAHSATSHCSNPVILGGALLCRLWSKLVVKYILDDHSGTAVNKGVTVSELSHNSIKINKWQSAV